MNAARRRVWFGSTSRPRAAVLITICGARDTTLNDPAARHPGAMAVLTASRRAGFCEALLAGSPGLERSRRLAMPAFSVLLSGLSPAPGWRPEDGATLRSRRALVDLRVIGIHPLKS